jgi:hypothetical protein
MLAGLRCGRAVRNLDLDLPQQIHNYHEQQ